MKPEEKLDTLLKLICDEEKFIASQDLWSKLNNQISETEFTPIINKLLLDKFIEKEVHKSATPNLNPPFSCRITFSGKLFCENGGYCSEAISKKRKQLWIRTKTVANFLNSILVLAVAIAAVYVSWKSSRAEENLLAKERELDSLKVELGKLKEKPLNDTPQEKLKTKAPQK